MFEIWLLCTCGSSVGNNFSFESAHLKALFGNTCNFFLVSLDAECIKTSPYSNISKIMFLYIMTEGSFLGGKRSDF